jgi:hypothetical protein
MKFRRYDHVERFGKDDVDGLTLGRVYVFPKLDGTNASVWWGENPAFGDPDALPEIIRCGSRNRELSSEKDNHGFCSWLHGDDPQGAALHDLLIANPSWIIYGEWMIPHTLKTYRPDTWRRFWIFDVFESAEMGMGRFNGYLPWEEYGLALRNMGLDVIEPLAIYDNPSEDQLRAQVAANTYLIQDGAGLGEGVVIKNYSWTNKYGRQPWAKIVRTEFKEDNRRLFDRGKAKQGAKCVELEIALSACTPELVGKTRAKIVSDLANVNKVDLARPNAQQRLEEKFRGRMIPQLLSRVYHDVVTEHLWDEVKKHRNPTVNFKTLSQHVTLLVKRYAEDLF